MSQKLLSGTLLITDNNDGKDKIAIGFLIVLITASIIAIITLGLTNESRSVD